MFGIMEALLSFIRRQVGLRTDVASSAGSAHAKLSYIAGKNIVAQGSAIKSIQRGTIVLSKSQTSKTAIISPVTTGKTMLNLLGVRAEDAFYASFEASFGYAYTSHFNITLELTNSTTITATRVHSNATEATVSYEVIEFY